MPWNLVVCPYSPHVAELTHSYCVVLCMIIREKQEIPLCPLSYLPFLRSIHSSPWSHIRIRGRALNICWCQDCSLLSRFWFHWCRVGSKLLHLVKLPRWFSCVVRGENYGTKHCTCACFMKITHWSWIYSCAHTLFFQTQHVLHLCGETLYEILRWT